MSGWMWRAPKLMTGSGAAASTNSRAAVAQPVDWASMPEERGLVQPELAVAAPDAQHDLARPDAVAVVQRLELGLRRVGAGQHVAEQVLGLVDAAQHGVVAREDLHRHERVEALGREDAVRPREVDVGRIAGQDLVRGSGALDAHQSGSAPGAGRVVAAWPAGGSAPAAPGRAWPRV